MQHLIIVSTVSTVDDLPTVLSCHLDPGRLQVSDPGRLVSDPGRLVSDPGRLASDPGRLQVSDPGRLDFEPDRLVFDPVRLLFGPCKLVLLSILTLSNLQIFLSDFDIFVGYI